MDNTTTPEEKISIVMQELAAAIDESIQRLVGDKMAFSFVVFPLTEKGRVNYIANCDREYVQDALKQLLNHWNNGRPDVPAHKVQ